MRRTWAWWGLASDRPISQPLEGRWIDVDKPLYAAIIRHLRKSIITLDILDLLYAGNLGCLIALWPATKSNKDRLLPWKLSICRFQSGVVIFTD